MKFHPIRLLTFGLVSALGLFTVMPAEAQSSSQRPGSSARTNTRSNTTTSRTGGSGGGSSSASSSGGARQYRSNTLLGDATVQIDPETRSLVIVTDEETHSELDKVIRNLDHPKPQVLIKVVFVEVTYNKGMDVGVEANYTLNAGTASPASTGSVTTTATQNRTLPDGTVQTVSTNTANTSTAAGLARSIGAQSLFGLASQTNGTFFRVVNDDWSATLRALATRGNVEILSRPSIMARNNQEAVIVVGQEVPFVTNSRITDNGQTINTVQYDNVGIILRVTPFITSEGTVEMIVAPEISALTADTVAISNNASAPIISKRSAETVVVTPNAQTVVIGGLMQTQRTESQQKVPILGDIPLLGYAFRRTVKNDVKQELLIFLTPYIVNSSGGLHEATMAELDKTELVEKAFTDKDLNKYLDMERVHTTEETVEVRPAVRTESSIELAPSTGK